MSMAIGLVRAMRGLRNLLLYMMKVRINFFTIILLVPKQLEMLGYTTLIQVPFFFILKEL